MFPSTSVLQEVTVVLKDLSKTSPDDLEVGQLRLLEVDIRHGMGVAQSQVCNIVEWGVNMHMKPRELLLQCGLLGSVEYLIRTRDGKRGGSLCLWLYQDSWILMTRRAARGRGAGRAG